MTCNLPRFHITHRPRQKIVRRDATAVSGIRQCPFSDWHCYRVKRSLRYPKAESRSREPKNYKPTARNFSTKRKQPEPKLGPFSVRRSLQRVTAHPMFPMYTDDDAFGDPHTDVAALVAALARSPGQYAWFAFEHTPDRLVVRVPAFGEFANRVVAFKGNVRVPRPLRRDIPGGGTQYGIATREMLFTAVARGCMSAATN